MNWLVIPTEDLKQFDIDWESRVKSVDGSQAILHEELYNELIPATLSLSDEVLEEEYPYELKDIDDIQLMLQTPEWHGIEEDI